MTIPARIAEVISPSEVAITAGTEKGVSEGDLVTMYRRIEVRDPDSQDVIGTVKRPHVRFQVVEVQPKMSVARTYERITEEEGSDMWASVLSGGRRIVQVTTNPKGVQRGVVFVSVGASVEVEPSDDDDLP